MIARDRLDAHDALKRALATQPHEAFTLVAVDLGYALLHGTADEVSDAADGLGREILNLAGDRSAQRGWWTWTEARRLANDVAKSMRTEEAKAGPWR